MAKVSLRIYNREIETLVDRGQLDEAIAHCRHILNTFPKNLETYRLLGKAYLEAKRYNEATDIFERLLMAVPDDFVAHVGMSIIHDEKKSMDAAIWHMERAFEVQPSNAAIQSELQRLFGRRDGVEPPKIRLTRGALAHMYVQGELYPQAISEINAVLEEDRERHDMQVLLARAYYHAGQKGEAAEMCSQLLRRYPYCFDANRVLVELLPETERGESTQVYRKRVNELDPYATFTTGSVFHTEEVPDAAVSLERLDWDGQPVDMQPEWGESMGIGLGDQVSTGDEEPDWLRSGLGSDASLLGGEPASGTGSIPVPSAGSDDEIPEFLREAGWGEDSGTFKEGSGDFGSLDESQEPAIAEGDLPDWVKAMAPTGAGMEDATPQTESDEDLTRDDVPDWLQGLGDAQSAPTEEQPAVEGDLPDWLESMKPSEEAMPESQPEEQMMVESTNDDNIPDWLKSMQSEEEQAAPEEIPQETPLAAAPESEPKPEPDIPDLSDESLSDWQIGDEAAAASVDFDATDTGALGTSADEQDDAIAWLEGLAAKHGAKPEELVTKPEDRSETEPEWVQKARTVKETGPIEETPGEPSMDLPDFLSEELAEPAEEPAAGLDMPVSPEQTPAETDLDLPDFLSKEPAVPAEEPAARVEPVDIGSLGASAEEQDDAVAWLESLAAKHGAKPEELVTDPEARKETAPEWVQRATEAGAGGPPAGEETPPEGPVEAMPEWMEPAEQAEKPLSAKMEEAPVEEPLPSADTDETGMWLRDMGEESGFAEEQEPTGEAESPATGNENVPDWLREMESETSKAEAAPTSEEEAAIPDWLRETDTGPSQEETLPEPSSEEEAIAEPARKAVSKIDVNTASIEELAELPGIGDLLAQNIVAHRETYGSFSSVEDLSNIAGIGPSTIDELQGLVEFHKVEAAAQPEEPDVTEWLQDMEAESSGAGAEITPAGEAVSDDLPSWLAGLDDDKGQPEPAAGADSDLPEWLRTVENVPAEPEPIDSADWLPADVTTTAPEEPPVPTPEPEPKTEEPPVQAAPAPAPEPEPKPAPPPPLEREPYREPITRSRTGMTGMLSAVQEPALTQAQNELTRGNIPGAMESYGKLIKKGKMLDEIIFDLREALYRYPVEVPILQALGDAYMRANRLQDALDAYTKAEELLR